MHVIDLLGFPIIVMMPHHGSSAHSTSSSCGGTQQWRSRHAVVPARLARLPGEAIVVSDILGLSCVGIALTAAAGTTLVA